MKSYVGNCINSFDEEDGNCIVPRLPYRDVSHFAVSEENAEPITAEEFSLRVDISDFQAIHSHPDTIHLHDSLNNVDMLYDGVHYFFA